MNPGYELATCIYITILLEQMRRLALHLFTYRNYTFLKIIIREGGGVCQCELIDSMIHQY